MASEYAYNGKIIESDWVTVDGIDYHKSQFENVSDLIPVKETPTINNATRTLDWNSGSVINGEWVRFIVRNKTESEISDYNIGQQYKGEQPYLD